MKKSRLFLLIPLMVISLCVSSKAIAAEVKAPADTAGIVKAGGGSIGGVGFIIMTAVSDVTKKAFPRLIINTVPGGWIGNLSRIERGELDIATSSAASFKVVEATPSQKIGSVRSLFASQDKSYYFAMVRSDIPANSLGEIIEKKIPVRWCTNGKNNTTELIFRTLFESKGAGWKEVESWGGKVNFISWNDAVDQIKDGHADGLLAIGLEKIGWLLDLTQVRDMKFVAIEPELIEVAKKKFGVKAGVIPGGIYRGIPDPHTCLEDTGLNFVSEKMPDNQVIAILQAVADNVDAYRKYHPAFASFKPENMPKDMPLPLHKAAERYYKSKGWIQ